LTPVLLRAVVRVTLLLLGLALLVVGFVFDFEQSLGVVIGGVLAAADGLGLIYLVGRLLDPPPTAAEKAAKPTRELPRGLLFGLIAVKLTVIGGLLWAALKALPGSGLGIVIGVSQGTTSPEGQAAMAEAERRIRESEAGADGKDRNEARDKDEDSG